MLLALPLFVAAQDVCDRTPAVRDKLVESAGVSACEDVTDSHLSQVTSLDFENMGIASLQADDFSDLSNLETLDLSRNRLSSLPEGVFEGLGSLQTLNLWSNDLTGLDEGVFEGLGNLEMLRLGGNDLSSLAAELFDGLGKLQDLRLHYNELTGLPEEIFDDLGKLERLEPDNWEKLQGRIDLQPESRAESHARLCFQLSDSLGRTDRHHCRHPQSEVAVVRSRSLYRQRHRHRGSLHEPVARSLQRPAVFGR